MPSIVPLFFGKCHLLKTVFRSRSERSTWIAVHYQVEVVPPEASVAYRISLAAVFMFGWTAFRRLPLKFSARDHFFMVLQGMLILSTNFFLFYHAAAYLTTGLIAVIFSTASAMTHVINSLLLKRWPAKRVIHRLCRLFRTPGKD